MLTYQMCYRKNQQFLECGRYLIVKIAVTFPDKPRWVQPTWCSPFCRSLKESSCKQKSSPCTQDANGKANGSLHTKYQLLSFFFFWHCKWVLVFCTNSYLAFFLWRDMPSSSLLIYLQSFNTLSLYPLCSYVFTYRFPSHQRLQFIIISNSPYFYSFN